MRELFVTPQFEKDLLLTPIELRKKADELIKQLLILPTDNTINISKLHGFNPPLWRVRIGAFRLIYSFDKKRLILHRFRHRKDVYKF